LKLNLHYFFFFGHNGVQLGLKFAPNLQLDFYAFFNPPRPTFFTLPASILFFWIFIFLTEKVNLGNNPEMSYDSCPSLYNAYDRKSCEKL